MPHLFQLLFLSVCVRCGVCWFLVSDALPTDAGNQLTLKRPQSLICLSLAFLG